MAFLTTQTVAKLLGVTPDAVRYLERTGRLLAIKLERGPGQIQRLFLEEDVQRCQQAAGGAASGQAREAVAAIGDPTLRHGPGGVPPDALRIGAGVSEETTMCRSRTKRSGLGDDPA